MALKWTKTSGPPSREMKPYPLASLNHFTVPVRRAMIVPLAKNCGSLIPRRRGNYPRRRDPTIASLRPPVEQRRRLEAVGASFVQLSGECAGIGSPPSARLGGAGDIARYSATA